MKKILLFFFYLIPFLLFSQNWTQIGQDIDGEAANDQSGKAISFSSDGKIVAIGAYDNNANPANSNSGHVRVYEEINGVWSQIGGDIDGTYNENIGHSVALNDDGNIVAVGAPYVNGNGSTNGRVRVYENINGTWTQIGQDMYGGYGQQFGWSVDLDHDGSNIVIGAIDGNNSGFAVIFNYDGTIGIKLVELFMEFHLVIILVIQFLLVMMGV